MRRRLGRVLEAVADLLQPLPVEPARLDAARDGPAVGAELARADLDVAALVMEDEEIEWFATIMSFWGEEKGLAYMQRLAAQNYIFRAGHTLMTQLVAAGEYPGAVILYAPQTQSVRNSGAPPQTML